MIQFVFSAASIPYVLAFAILLGALVCRLRLSPDPVILGPSYVHQLKPGEVYFPGEVELVPGEAYELPRGTEIAFRTRLGLPFALAWNAARRAVSETVRGVLLSLLAVLAAIGLYVIVASASALLTPRAAPGQIERPASYVADPRA